MSVGYHRVIGRQDQRQVLQLFIQTAVAVFCRLQQLLRAHASALQLVHRLQQHALQLRALPGCTVDLKPGPDSIQRQGHT